MSDTMEDNNSHYDIEQDEEMEEQSASRQPVREEEEEEEEEDGPSTQSAGRRNSRNQAQEEEQEEEEEEEEQDEEEGDEDDEDDEEDGPRRKKRRVRKTGVSRFLDVEAEVDDEDDEDEDDEEYHKDKDFITDVPQEEEDVDHRRAVHHQRFDRRQRELSDADLARLAQDVEQRYRRSAASVPYSGDMNSVPQRLLMPSVQDANLWQVRVKPGKEKDIVFSLMRKALDLEYTAKPLQILSAFQRENLSGIIYVESRSHAAVQQACSGLVGIFLSRGVNLVPIEEMSALLLVKKKESALTPGTWVRIKRGKYQGDLAQVMDVTENGEEAGLKFIPRIDLTPRDESTGTDGKKRKKTTAVNVHTRPPQKFFNFEEVAKTYGRRSITKRGKAYIFMSDTFTNGFIEKDIRTNALITEDVNPTLEEITMFAKQQDGDDALLEGKIDLSVIADASKKAAINVLQPGDHVEVFEGEQTGVQGSVESITGEIATLQIQGYDLDGAKVEVPAKSVRKKFRIGDHVKVMAGKNVDETGLVVATTDNIVTFVSDMTNGEVSVFSKDIREAAEVGASTNVVGNYELHDLVQLDATTVGVIFKTERDSFRVLDQNGQVRLVHPHQISMRRDSLRAVGTDAQGFEVRPGDNMKEAEGEGRSGIVLHIHQSYFAFVHNRDVAENGGIFVTRTRALVSVAPKNVTRQTAPDLSKLNPAVNGFAAQQGGTVGSSMFRGPRDRLIGLSIIIVKGQYKSYSAIIKDTNGPIARVELGTSSKVVSIDRDKLKWRDPQDQKLYPLDHYLARVYKGNMQPPSDARGGGYGKTPNPYADGGKTPRWGSGKTPNPHVDGGRTPGWGGGRTPNPYTDGKTPAWNASARTPNPFADSGKTPAWAPSSRTPNPYAAGGNLGSATPARPGGWGSATPARHSWGEEAPTPYTAPTPGVSSGSYGAAPTPRAWGAPTPGNTGNMATPYSAPTPGFGMTGQTPRTAPTPYGTQDTSSTGHRFSAPKEWLLDPMLKGSGYHVYIRNPTNNSSFSYTQYENQEGVVLGVFEVLRGVSTAHVRLLRSDESLQQVPIDILRPVLPKTVNDKATALDGQLKGKHLDILDFDSHKCVVREMGMGADGMMVDEETVKLCLWEPGPL